jgi:hypothetical protein
MLPTRAMMPGIDEPPLQPSVRAESGNPISKVKPSFEAGSAGGDGSAGADIPCAGGDFVSELIGILTTVGACQARRCRVPVVPDLVGRIIRLRTFRASRGFYEIAAQLARQHGSRHRIAI